MATVQVVQRHAHLAGAVRLEFVNGREGKVAKAVPIAISNTRRGSSDSREEESTGIQWTLWGKQAENAAEYLGKGSHVNIVGRLVRVASPEVVDSASPDAEKLLAVLRASGAEGCYVYAFDANARDAAYARFFNPTVGLWEDAATGTAAGPLAAYLGASGMLKGDTLTIEQGAKMGRTSLIRVRLVPEISGAGVIVLRGTLRV